MKINGGNVFTGVSRIKKEEVLPTVEDLAKNFLNPRGILYQILGSAEKKETSGDIDIGVLFSYLDAERYLVAQIRDDLPSVEAKIFKGMNMVSIKYPIVQSSDHVQIDLMVTDDLKYTKFAYDRDKFATLLINKISTIVLPFNESNYDSASGILGFRNVKRTERFYFNNAHGLVYGVKYQKINKKTGEISQRGDYIGKRYLKNVEQIIDVLFGPYATENNLKTVETIQKFVNSNKAHYGTIDIGIYPKFNHIYFLAYTPEYIQKINEYIEKELYTL